MARARNKKQLIEFGENEYSKLIGVISQLIPKQRDEEFIFDNRTAKDIIAHIYAWQLLELDWYKKGMNGETPESAVIRELIEELGISSEEAKPVLVGTHLYRNDQESELIYFELEY